MKGVHVVVSSSSESSMTRRGMLRGTWTCAKERSSEIIEAQQRARRATQQHIEAQFFGLSALVPESTAWRRRRRAPRATRSQTSALRSLLIHPPTAQPRRHRRPNPRRRPSLSVATSRSRSRHVAGLLQASESPESCLTVAMQALALHLVLSWPLVAAPA